MEEDLVDLVIPALLGPRWIEAPKEDDDITGKKWWGKSEDRQGRLVLTPMRSAVRIGFVYLSLCSLAFSLFREIQFLVLSLSSRQTW